MSDRRRGAINGQRGQRDNCHGACIIRSNVTHHTAAKCCCMAGLTCVCVCVRVSRIPARAQTFNFKTFKIHGLAFAAEFACFLKTQSRKSHANTCTCACVCDCAQLCKIAWTLCGHVSGLALTTASKFGRRALV